jgi:hypothetical protein
MTTPKPTDHELLEHLRAADPISGRGAPEGSEGDDAWARVVALAGSSDRASQDETARRLPGRRRTTLRTGALSLAALAILSGTALAAGSALGIIDLGGGVSATPVSTIPVWDGTTGTFVNATVGASVSAAGTYAYHITGGTTTVECPFTDPARYQTEPNDIYVTSSRPLSAAELELLVPKSNPTPMDPDDVQITRNPAGQIISIGLMPGTPAYEAAQQGAATWKQLQADGAISTSGFDHPIGAGCFGPGEPPPSVPAGTTQTEPTAGSTASTNATR